MNEDKDVTLISVRNPVLMNISLLKQSEIQNDIYKIIELLKQNGHVKIRLLCHDHRDISFAASFKNVPYMYVDEPLNYLALLKNCRLNITYRVHSALPCMAFKTPFIKLSYDERAISLMETLGFKEWNINIVNTSNLLKEIKYRINNLDKIEIYLKKAKKIWLELKTTQENAMKKFAKAAKLHSLI
jgi:polysaccharide pyruvyl transferase WcaK-like protein